MSSLLTATARGTPMAASSCQSSAGAPSMQSAAEMTKIAASAARSPARSSPTKSGTPGASMRLTVSPLLSKEAAARPTDRSRSPSCGRRPGTRVATRWSNSVDLPAPPGPTRTTLRMSSGVRVWGAGVESVFAAPLLTPPPCQSPVEGTRAGWRRPGWSGPGGRDDEVTPAHVAVLDPVVAEVGQCLVQLRRPRRVVGDVAVGGDGRPVVGLEEVAELRAGREPVDVELLAGRRQGRHPVPEQLTDVVLGAPQRTGG